MNAPPVSLMRDRVEIQSRAVNRGVYGEVSAPSWTSVATRWARVEPLSGREAWQAQQVRPDVTHKVTLRYYEGLGPRHRLKAGSRVFNITSVIDTENRHREMVCVCVEEVAT